MSKRKRWGLASGAALVVVMGGGLFTACELRTEHADSSKPAENAAPAAKPLMAESQSEYLWDIESHGNKLARTNYGLKAFGVALSHADWKAFEGLLASGFVGETPGKP